MRGGRKPVTPKMQDALLMMHAWYRRPHQPTIDALITRGLVERGAPSMPPYHLTAAGITMASNIALDAYLDGNLEASIAMAMGDDE